MHRVKRDGRKKGRINLPVLQLFVLAILMNFTLLFGSARHFAFFRTFQFSRKIIRARGNTECFSPRFYFVYISVFALRFRFFAPSVYAISDYIQ